MQQLYDAAVIKPSIIQKRFEISTAYQAEMRKGCNERNDDVIAHDLVSNVASTLDVSSEVALYLLIRGLKGVCMVNGTQSESHIRGDVQGLEKWKYSVVKEGNGQKWRSYIQQFEQIVE